MKWLGKKLFGSMYEALDRRFNELGYNQRALEMELEKQAKALEDRLTRIERLMVQQERQRVVTPVNGPNSPAPEEDWMNDVDWARVQGGRR